MSLEIVEKYFHNNGAGAPFVIAIVDDTAQNDTKLVIMFDEDDYTAVLSLDALIESEDITPEGNSHPSHKYERALREHLWGRAVEDEDDADFYGDEESETF